MGKEIGLVAEVCKDLNRFGCVVGKMEAQSFSNYRCKHDCLRFDGGGIREQIHVTQETVLHWKLGWVV